MKRMSSRDLTLYLLVILLMVFAVTSLQQMNRTEAPTYSQIRSYFLQEQVQSFTLKDNTLRLTLRGEGDQTTTVTYEMSDQALTYFYMDMRELIDDQLAAGILESYDYPPGLANSWWYNWLPSLIVLLSVGFLLFVLYRQRMASMGGGGGAPGASRFGHARTKTLSDQGKKVTFDDVAGAEEEKEELQEIVEFLRDPQKFTALGARIPKGVLLVGPPGTGKTLIAKAVAGEAGVHFLSISGSDFVELYVGVGASRVRDLFDQAKKDAPAIVFIDEIDAVGRQRGAGLGGGHDEREQTLNQLLVEMDGFESNEGVILIAATNRPDVLDPALLRPGRFDRQVVVPTPDVKGRLKILEVHTRRTPLDKRVNLEVIARGTPGFSGAALENLVNEAALQAARLGQDTVFMRDFEYAKDKVLMGKERRSLILSDEEKRITAYHEGGHALVAKLLPGTDPVHKVTIIPRGRALGVTMQLPEGDRHGYSKAYLQNNLMVLLAGRVAEEIIFDTITTGAGNDIERATGMARKMVCEWGMSDVVGPMTIGEQGEEVFIGRDWGHARNYSEDTARIVDAEIKKLVETARENCHNLLQENINLLHALAKALLDRETIDALIAEHDAAPHLRVLQKRLAEEITCMIHSHEEYEKAVEASAILFGGATSEALHRLDEQTLLQVFEGVPQYRVARAELAAGVPFVDLCAEKSDIFASKGECRKLVQGGGVSLNKEKVADAMRPVTDADLIAGKYLLVQRGKKNYYLVIAE